MSKEELLQKYEKEVLKIKQCAKIQGLQDKDIDRVFLECFNCTKISSNDKKAQNYARFFFVLTVLFLIISLCAYILLTVHIPTSSIVLRNVQGLIYPGFKLIRQLSVPIIKIFPSLTDLYDETCLVENPYFYVSEMECWPCENVYSVKNLSNFNEKNLLPDFPFITKTDENLVSFDILKQFYKENKAVLSTDIRRFSSTNSTITNLPYLFKEINSNDLLSSMTHISWRINKMHPARIIRKIFPRPKFISEWSGQAVERFIFIDSPLVEPYKLPNTECSYVFVIQAFGERTLVLKPSKECSNNCRPISVILKEFHVLSYNWWYWKPISLPSENSSQISVTYMNSYC